MTEKLMLGMLPARDAEFLQSRLAKQGIEIACVFNHSSCKTGCSPSKEVWAHPEDVESIQGIMRDEHLKALADLGADVSLLSEVFDPGNETATCPACGTQFATSLGECSDCGLSFGG